MTKNEREQICKGTLMRMNREPEYPWTLAQEKVEGAASILRWTPEHVREWLTVTAEENLLEEDCESHQEFLTRATAEELATWVENDHDLYIRAIER